MIATIALLLFLQPEQYPWFEVSRDRQGTHFIDVLSVRAIGDRRFLRHRVDFVTVRVNGAVTAEYEVQISCTTRTIALLEGEEWNEAAQTVQSHSYPQPTARSIGPNSLGATLYRIVCDRDSPVEPFLPSPGRAPPEWAPTN